MIEQEIISELNKHEVDFIHFVDVSKLSETQNKGFVNAILFGIVLTPRYINELANDPDYVKKRIEDNFNFDDDEYYLKELKTGSVSDSIVELIISKGYKAYSLSDENQVETGFFDGMFGKTPLPHKTISS